MIEAPNRARVDTAADAAPLLMIDRVGTRDRDDAITATACGDGWDIEVHIAAVADVVAAGSATDKQAFVRAETRYGRHHTVPMLGAAAERRATLSTDTARTSLNITAHCDRSGHLSRMRLTRGVLQQGRCTALDHTHIPAIADDAGHRLHSTVTALDRAARALLAARRDAGAVAFYDMDHGWATDEDGAPVILEPCERTIGYVIVQEFMIAANHAAAHWCIEEAVPILFRTHRRNPTDSPGSSVREEIAAAADDPILLGRLRHRLAAGARPARYEAVVGGHHGLRLSAYTHITSPLRRIADLINQRIVFAHLDGIDTPYTPAQLAAIGDDLDRRARERKDTAAQHFSGLAAAAVDANITADPAGLDPAALSKVIARVRAHPLPGELAAEIVVRAREDRLSIADTAVLLTATGPGWPDLAVAVLDIAETARPHWAPSLTSILRQLDPQLPEIALDAQIRGPDHRRQFAARAHQGNRHGQWTIAATKKAANHQALWSLLRTPVDASSTGTEPNDLAEPRNITDCAACDIDPPWNDEGHHEDRDHHTAPVSASAASDLTDGAAVTIDAVTDAQAPLGENTTDAPTMIDVLARSRKHKALSNPIAWLTSLAANTQQPAPIYRVSSTGPAHRPDFTTTAAFAGLSVHAVATTKTASRTAAADALVHALFDHYHARNTPVQ